MRKIPRLPQNLCEWVGWGGPTDRGCFGKAKLAMNKTEHCHAVGTVVSVETVDKHTDPACLLPDVFSRMSPVTELSLLYRVKVFVVHSRLAK